VEDPSPLRRIYFGHVNLVPPVETLRRNLDRSLESVLAALPPPLLAGAKELVAAYARRSADSVTAEPSFFQHFYSPLWSWIHWAAASTQIEEVVTGQALSMFLHLLDDHLCDGQLRCDPLLLQLRTAAWMRLEECVHKLAMESDSGQELWQSDLSRYFAAIQRPPPINSLDGYCARFRDQMATCVAIPALTLRRQGNPAAADDLRQIVFGLGVAWRLIDDVQDAYADWTAGQESILYSLLHEQPSRGGSKEPPESAARLPDWVRIVEKMYRSGILKEVLERCSAELLQAAELAQQRSWVGLSEELRQLRHPVADLVSRMP
jgi:hypothetical protein